MVSIGWWITGGLVSGFISSMFFSIMPIVVFIIFMMMIEISTALEHDMALVDLEIKKLKAEIKKLKGKKK